MRDDAVPPSLRASALGSLLLIACRPSRNRRMRASIPTRHVATAHTELPPCLWFGGVLIVAQVALTLVLLVGAGLFARSLSNVWRIDGGFDPDSLLVFRIDPSQAG
jgi:hypothetical protein